MENLTFVLQKIQQVSSVDFARPILFRLSKYLECPFQLIRAEAKHRAVIYVNWKMNSEINHQIDAQIDELTMSLLS